MSTQDKNPVVIIGICCILIFSFGIAVIAQSIKPKKYSEVERYQLYKATKVAEFAVEGVSWNKDIYVVEIQGRRFFTSRSYFGYWVIGGEVPPDIKFN